MTQLEKVARAICMADGENPDATLAGDGRNFLWEEYQAQAQAAIDAILGEEPQP